jgi:hypothetical protein
VIDTDHLVRALADQPERGSQIRVKLLAMVVLFFAVATHSSTVILSVGIRTEYHVSLSGDPYEISIVTSLLEGRADEGVDPQVLLDRLKNNSICQQLGETTVLVTAAV